MILAQAVLRGIEHQLRVFQIVDGPGHGHAPIAADGDHQLKHRRVAMQIVHVATIAEAAKSARVVSGHSSTTTCTAMTAEEAAAFH